MSKFKEILNIKVLICVTKSQSDIIKNRFFLIKWYLKLTAGFIRIKATGKCKYVGITFLWIGIALEQNAKYKIISLKDICF